MRSVLYICESTYNMDGFNRLLLDHPVLYKQYGKPCTGKPWDGLSTHWGFNCGKGWFLPIRKLSDKLELLNVLFRKHGISIQANEVAEKHGTLHYYYNIEVNWKTKVLHWFMPSKIEKEMRLVDRLAQELISEASRECYSICEECGKDIGTESSPRMETPPWTRYLCMRCYNLDKIYAKEVLR